MEQPLVMPARRATGERPHVISCMAAGHHHHLASKQNLLCHSWCKHTGKGIPGGGLPPCHTDTFQSRHRWQPHMGSGVEVVLGEKSVSHAKGPNRHQPDGAKGGSFQRSRVTLKEQTLSGKALYFKGSRIKGRKICWFCIILVGAA